MDSLATSGVDPSRLFAWSGLANDSKASCVVLILTCREWDRLAPAGRLVNMYCSKVHEFLLFAGLTRMLYARLLSNFGPSAFCVYL